MSYLENWFLNETNQTTSLSVLDISSISTIVSNYKRKYNLETMIIWHFNLVEETTATADNTLFSTVDSER